jgi:Ca-activated chloride channel homolog
MLACNAIQKSAMSLRCVCILYFLCSALSLEAQYYFRGEIKDPKNNPLPLVRIRVHSTNSFYYSGTAGGFGVPSHTMNDTVTLFLNGYEERTVAINSNTFNSIILRVNANLSVGQKKRLLSFTRDKEEDKVRWWSTYGETYSDHVENEFNLAEKFPTTGFSLGIDKASYSNVRRFINMNSAVPPAAVRIEEMLNYFPSKYIEPKGDSVFHVESQVTDCPWAKGNRLLFLKLHAKKIKYDHLPPGNLVFLIDVSGSMDLPNRLPLLKTAFRLLVQNLRPVDTVSIVVYGGTFGVMLQPTSGIEKQKIMSVIDSLHAGGETPGESAIRMAYNIAQSKFIKGGNNRIILATDGDFNVGEVSEDALMQLIIQKQKTGIYLTCLGVGMGNYKDSKLEILAKKGNGNFAYLDNVLEAEKVLVTELMQTLYTVSNETFLNVSFNPGVAKSYRLIGYDNRKDALADSTSMLEGGEVGSGHTVTAVFEIEPADSLPHKNELLAKLALNFQKPGRKEKTEQVFTCLNNYLPLTVADSSYGFNAAVALFGLLLKNSPYVNSSHWETVQLLAIQSASPADQWQVEMKQLIDKARLIYAPPKQKKFLKRKKKEE